MHGDNLFLQALVYLAAAVLAVPIAKRLGLGSVLGYLIAGAVIGPFGLALVGDKVSDVMHVAEFGVVMMLFLVGLELDPKMLWRLRASILGLGGLQLALTTVVVALGAVVVGLDLRTGIAVGLILAMSSTAIVLQGLGEKGLMGTPGGQGSFAVLLFQDIAVIPILALLPLLAVAPVAAPPASAAAAATPEGTHGAAATLLDRLPPWGDALAVLVAVALIALAGRFLVVPGLRWIARTRQREIFTAAALLIVVGIALLMAWLGVSPALGTFLAGVVLANSEYRHELMSDIDPFKGLLLGLFFMAVGSSIDFALIAARPLLVAALVVAIMGAKLAVLAPLGRAFGMAWDQALLLAFALSQVGEFAFVLLSFSVNNGILSGATASPLVAATALSMAMTPLLMLLYERGVLPRLARPDAGTERAHDEVHGHAEVIVAGFGRFGQIVGRLLRANGVRTTVLEIDPDRVDVLRRFGLEVYYGDASRHDLLEAAGAAHARMLVLAIDNPEKTLELVHTAKRHFPQLRILARAEERADAYELLEAGVDHIYRETLDSSLRMGADALRLLGFRAYHAQRAARTFLRHDEASVRALAAVRGDRATYMSLARQQIGDLETLLKDDLAGHDLDRDAGWDADTLRAEYGR